MAPNFLLCDRDQELLLPPSLREWLPQDHLAWFVLDAVEEMDLSAFVGAYREDGWGRAAFDPQMVVALLLTATRSGSARAGGSSDDRALSRPPRAGAGRHVCAGADAVCEGRAGVGGSGGARRQPALGQCLAAGDAQLRVDP